MKMPSLNVVGSSAAVDRLPVFHCGLSNLVGYFKSYKIRLQPISQQADRLSGGCVSASCGSLRLLMQTWMRGTLKGKEFCGPMPNFGNRLSPKLLQQHDIAFSVIDLMVQKKFAMSLNCVPLAGLLKFFCHHTVFRRPIETSGSRHLRTETFFPTLANSPLQILE